jgi:xylulokinase
VPLRLTGGGSVHPAWRQMLADVLGRPLHTIEVADASARGAAILGGMAIGWWTADMLATLAPRSGDVTLPDATRVAHYEDLYQCFQKHEEV